MREEAPSLVRTSFGRPASPTDIRGETTSQPSVRSAFQCKQLNCGITGKFAEASILGALLKSRRYSEVEQIVYSVDWWNDLQKLAKSKSYPFDSFKISFFLAFYSFPDLAIRLQSCLRLDLKPSYMLTVRFQTCYKPLLYARGHVLHFQRLRYAYALISCPCHIETGWLM